MHICVLENTRDESTADLSQYMPEHTFEHVLIHKATAVQQIRDLRLKKFDVFINLCDGAWDHESAGIEVIHALEHFNLPFTGANSECYEPSKEYMKTVALFNGIPTPAFYFAFDQDGIEEAAKSLTFPLIVKHYNGYSSIGMTKNSRVETPDQLYPEANRFITEFGGALIEEFIEGREFTVLVAENPKEPDNPLAFTPIECIFSEGETFKHYQLKWFEYEKISWLPVTEPQLAHNLKEIAKKVFVGIKGVGYGRCDFRMDKDGNLYFLEINPNCGIFYPSDCFGSADFILKNDPIGHRGFLEHIINCAFFQHAKRTKKYHVAYNKFKGFTVRAAIDIQKGELITQHEEANHCLVTKAHVEHTWSAAQKQWFEKYSYPVSDDVYVMFIPRNTRNACAINNSYHTHSSWLPIQSGSGTPNAHLLGLNLVASKDIQRGEPIFLS